MAEMRLTKKRRERIASLLAALGQGKALRSRLQRDARGVLEEFGLGGLVPPDVDLKVEVEKPVAAGRLANSVHLDATHIDDSTPFPDPLPPSHLDLSHIDAVLRKGGPRPSVVLQIRGVPAK